LITAADKKNEAILLPQSGCSVQEPIECPLDKVLHFVSESTEHSYPCFKPHESTIIPPVSPLRHVLEKKYRDPNLLYPSKTRKFFVFIPLLDHNIVQRRLAGLGSGLFPTIKSEKIVIGQKNADVNELISQSVFCLYTPGGPASASLVYEMMYAGCIPVIISSNLILAFDEILDWRQFSVRVREDELYMIESRLIHYSDADIAQLQSNVLKARNAFWYGGKMSLDAVDGMNPLRLTIANLVRRLQTSYPPYN
jgi:hypothetical protein